MRDALVEKIKQFFISIYRQLIEIDDSPQRKAIGLGIGVFLGNWPGLGPATALVAAFILRVNKAAALLGSILTNTWLSVVTFVISLKIGAWLTGNDWQALQTGFQKAFEGYHWYRLSDWSRFTDAAVLRTIGAVFLGYTVVSFVIAVCVYCAALFVLLKQQKSARPKT